MHVVVRDATTLLRRPGAMRPLAVGLAGLALLAGVSALGGCSLLPPGHQGVEFFERPFRELRNDFGRAAATLRRDVVRGIDRTRRFAVELPAQAERRGATVVRDVQAQTAMLWNETTRLPHEVRSSAGRVVRRADTDLRTIATPWNWPYEPFQVEETVGRTRQSFAQVPHTLRLDRRPFADATDPEHQVTVEPTTRSRTWVERILGRLRW